MSCVRCSMEVLSVESTIVLPVECLGYGLVVPFLAYRFALWFRIMKIKQSKQLKQACCTAWGENWERAPALHQQQIHVNDWDDALYWCDSAASKAAEKQ